MSITHVVAAAGNARYKILRSTTQKLILGRIPNESKSISSSPLSDKVERTGGDANMSAAVSDVGSSDIKRLELVNAFVLLAAGCMKE